MLQLKHILFHTILVGTLVANDGFDEGGFDDEESIEIVQVEEKKEDFSIYGFLSNSLNYNYDNQKELSSNRVSANIKLEYILNENTKIKSIIKAYKDFKTNINDDREIDINELTIQSTIGNNIDIKFGRQIVVWGKSDNIRITDTLNPLDNRTPAMTDIEDLRLGRVMTRIDLYNNNWNYSGMILHENRYTLMPELGSDYYLSIPMATEPSNSASNTGIALSASSDMQGEDIAFYYSNQFVDTKSYRTNMLGMAYNKVINSFLIKTEVAHFDEKTDALIGLEYTGIHEGSISLEVANKDNEIQYAARFNQSYINQTLDFTTLATLFGKDLNNGGFIRSWLNYEIDDNFEADLGIVDYIGGDKIIFENIKDQDRVFATIKYNF